MITDKQLKMLTKLIDERQVPPEDAEFCGRLLESGMTRDVAADLIDAFKKHPRRVKQPA